MMENKKEAKAVCEYSVGQVTRDSDVQIDQEIE
jgi:hypothetical protein